jgi:dimethylglycine dehydrogenase
MGLARMDLGFAPAVVARLSVSGELGYEIYVPTAYLSALLDVLLQAQHSRRSPSHAQRFE